MAVKITTLKGRIRFRAIAVFTVLTLACPIVNTFAQEVPPPKPKADAPTRSSKQTELRRSVLVESDMDVVLTIDGGAGHRLKEGVPVRYPIGLGEHLLRADGLGWYDEKTVTITGGDTQTIVHFTIKQDVAAKEAAERTQQEEANRQQQQREAYGRAQAAAMRERLVSLIGNWRYETEPQRLRWGSGCSGMEWTIEFISIQNISADGSYASGTIKEYYQSSVTRDPEGRCTVGHYADHAAHYQQTGSLKVRCPDDDSCEVSIIYSPCEGGDQCDKHTESPGAGGWTIPSSGRSPQSFTRSNSEVFKKQ
jgi:hypothetical protein